MDEKELIDGLRGLKLAEPRLGFDPDQLADRSAHRQRTFRQVVATSTGTLVVAGLAVGTLFFVSAGQSLPMTPGGSTAQPAPLNEANLSKPAARIKAHLQQILPAMLPEARDLRIGQIFQGSDEDRIMAGVEFRGAEGPTRFIIDVLGPVSTHGLADALKERCECGPPIIQRDSSEVYVDKGYQGEKNPWYAVHYRKDGTTVIAMNSRMHPMHALPEGPDPEDRSRFPFTREQLIALATDPALNAK